MADTVLTIDAEVKAAVAKLEEVNKTLLGVVSTVKNSSVIYDAYGNQASAAIDKVDAVTKKTSGSTSALRKTLNEMGDAIQNPAASMTKMASSFVAGYLSVAALQTAGMALLGFLSDSVTEFTNAEAASKKLNVALQNQGQDVPKVRAAYDGLGREFERTTVYSGGLITEMQTLLVQVGNVAPSQMKRALQASADLSAGLGIDLKAATTLVAKAFAGGGDELGKLKQILGDTVPEGASMAQVLDAINQKFGGQAQAQIGTYAGQIAQLNNQWAGLKEEVGGVIAESGLLTAAHVAVKLELTRTKSVVEAINFAMAASNSGVPVHIAMLGMMARGHKEVAVETERSLTPAEELARAQEAMRQKMEALRVEAAKLKTEAVKPLSDENRELAKTFHAGGVSADEIATKLGVSAMAVHALIESERRAADESKRATDELNRKSAERQQALERIRLLTVDVTDSQREHILSNHALGASETDIALALHIHEVQVGKVIDAEKERKKTAEDTAKAIKKFETERAQQFAEVQKATYEGLKDEAAARDELTVSTLLASLDAEEKIRLMSAAGLERRLLEIGQAEAAEILSAQTKYDVGSAHYQTIEDEIRARYAAERDLATATQSTIVERMREQGVLTRAEQEATVAALELEYLQMQASGEYTYAELEAAERRWRDASNEMSNLGVKQFLGHMDTMLSMASAFASGVGGKFGEVAGKAIAVAQDVSSMAGSFAAGDWVGGTIKALGLLGKAVAAVFPGNETKKAREEFAAGMDLTLDQLYKKLQSMGAKGQELANQALNVIGKHDEAGNKRWMKEVEAFFGSHQESLERERELLDEATISWEEAEDIAREFGITTTNSGKALEQAKIAEQGENIAVKWRQATLAGMDFTDVTTGMSDEVQTLITRSNEMGIDLPASLKKPVEEMIKLGLLTDANGEKITDMGAIRFTETPMDRLVTKLDELLSKVFGVGTEAETATKKASEAFDKTRLSVIGVGDAIDDLPGTIPITVKWDVGEFPEMPGGGGAGGSKGGVPAFSKGSDGIQDFGTRTLAWLHGREGVFTEAQITAIVQQAGRYGVGAVPTDVAGMTFAAGAVSQAGPTVIINAPVDASGSMFKDRRAMTDLAEIVSDRIAAKYRGSFPVGVR
jgi:transposase